MKRLTDGTSGFTSGLRLTTWRGLTFPARIFGFALAVCAVAYLIAQMDVNIWRAQNHLEKGFAAIKAERFYFGVNFRVKLRKLSDSLLDYQLTANPADLESFRHEANELQGWLKARTAAPMTPGEQAAYAKLEAAYGGFLQQVASLQRNEGSKPVDHERFGEAYERLKRDYQPVLNACDAVLASEHDSFGAFLHRSEQALLSQQRTFLMSLFLLIGLAVALAMLVYRGMIAPLRTRLIESQALIARQEKLASLGALGAGVAHEIRNPLTALKFRLFSLQSVLPPDLAENEDVRTMSVELNRLDRIVRDFLQFARPSEPELVRVPAERILQEVYDLLKQELERAGIGLRLEILQRSWVVADTHQLKQVLINLIQNAADSIRNSGTVMLRLKTATASFAGEVRPAVVLAITDTGDGIPAEAQKRLFDPFFTTKEGGTGLGLAIAARIVEKHGGLLRYETEVGRGTTFEVVLPGLKSDAS
jgi:signal transduction histidine kinase